MSTNVSPERLPRFLEARRTALPFDLGWRGGAFEAWRDRLLEAWRASLPPCGIVNWREDGGILHLTHATGAEVCGVLTLPPGRGPHPVVLLFHEHGGTFDIGWEKLHDHPASRDTRAALYGGRSVARAFHEAGVATLTCDAPCFGARQCGGYEGQQAFAANALGLGWSLAGISAAEAVGLVAWLAAEPRIGRIGTFGFSMGGYSAWTAAALSPLVRATASVGWLACRADLVAPGRPLLAGHSAWHFLHPGLSHRADFPDLAGLAADRPLFFRSGRNDRHMPEASVEKAWAHVGAIASAAGGPAPDTELHDHGHTCPPAVLDAAVDFLARHLAT